VRGAVVDPARGLVRLKGQRTVVRDFPISIDAQAFAERATASSTEALARQVRRAALPQGGQLVLGVDRVDYTKGIPRRFRAIARLLEGHPELRGQVTLLQIGVPSRVDVPEYAEYQQEVGAYAEEVNARFATAQWTPIRLVPESLDQAALVAHYRAADVCLVSPLLDGMNLVAKEFVACQEGRLGILVLSRFAGAAREMKEALLVNPYDIGAVAATLHQALSMPPEERERRMMHLRRRVNRHTIQDWMSDIFAEVAHLRRQA
jgi:trehalose-6-phosphate synthase